MEFKRKKIGEILVKMGAIAPAEIRLILERQQDGSGRFGKTGIDEGLFKEEILMQGLAEQFGLEYLDLSGFVLDQELVNSLPHGLPQRYRFVPITRADRQLLVAIEDPTNIPSLDELEELLDEPVVFKLATSSRITEILEKGEGSKQVLQEVSEDFKMQLVKETDKGEEILSLEKLTDDSSPIIRLIDSTLFDALTKRAI